MDQRQYDELRKLKVLAATDKDARLRLRAELADLTNTEKAEFARKMKLDDELSRPAINEFRGDKSQRGKVALIEYTNQSQDFLLRTMFLAMENYVYDRFRSMKQLDDAERSAISKFLDVVFNHSCSGHVDTVYDVFVKPLVRERDESLLASSAQINPAYIPTPKVIECDTFSEVIPLMYNDELLSTFDVIKCASVSPSSDEISDTVLVRLAHYYNLLVAPITIEQFRDLEATERWFIRKKDKLVPMPSYSQVRNASNYFINKFEEHRVLASMIFNQRPEHELLIHIHGLFDSMERADEYRVKESANIHGRAVVAPVGYSALGGDFKPNRESSIIYNPSDPDIELMINGQQNIRRAEAQVMKKRTMSKLADRADPETMKAIRDFTKAKERLRTEGEKKILSKYAADEQPEQISKIRHAQSILDDKVNEMLQFLDDEEVVIKPLLAKDGKLSQLDEMVVKLS